MKYFSLLILSLSLSGCLNNSDRLPKSFFLASQEDPSLSGNGEKIAVIVDQDGSYVVQLRNLNSGKIVPLKYLSRYKPHSSPTLSWSGRYLALISKTGNQRQVLIEDRLAGKIHRLRLPVNKIPSSLNFAPHGLQIAIEISYKGQTRVELFDLSHILEPDWHSKILM